MKYAGRRLTNVIFSLILATSVACSSGSKKSEAGSPIEPVSSKSPYSGHGAESVDPAVIAKFAPPPLPHGTTVLVQNILEVKSPGMGVLKPDGSTMYFGWSVTGTPQVWKLDGPLKFPTQMTSGPDPTSVVDITPDGEWLILSRDRAGEENPGLYLQSTKGGPVIEIQHKKDVRTSLVWVTNDSQTIYYRANDIKPDSYALYSYSIESKQKKLLFAEPGLWFVADVANDGMFLLGRSTGARTREYFTWSVKNPTLVPIIGQDEKEEYDVAFGASPVEFLVATPKFGEFTRLYSMKFGKLKPITPDVKMDVESFLIDYARRNIYVQWNDGGKSKLEVLNASNYKKVKFPSFPNADHVYVGRTTRFGRFATFGVETSKEPRSSYVYDWKTNKQTRWVLPSIPETDTSKFADSTIESYPARDGTKIPMLVTRPQVCAASPCPVIVEFHGGPEGQSRPGFNRLAQIFALAGFVYVEPNVRGSEGYGKAWLAADDGAKRLNVITDIEDASIHIRKAFASGDRAPRVGVMGWSYGGYATLLAMSRFAGAYDAGVALVGMSNLRNFLLNTAPHRRILRISEYGDPEKDKDALEQLSPSTYIDKVKDPLMIIQGVSDPRVPAGEAIYMQQLLEKRGIKAPLILFGNEGHGSIKLDNKVLEVGHALRFFQENLVGRN